MNFLLGQNMRIGIFLKGDKNTVQESTGLEIFLGGGKENEETFKAIRKKPSNFV